MLIDDDPVCHLINTKIIKLFSAFQIESFTDPLKALNKLKEVANDGRTMPDYILLDINMPGINGWQFLDEYEKLPMQELGNSCVIMLSSSTSHLDIEKSKQYKSVKHFVSKPLTQEKVRLIEESCTNKEFVLQPDPI